MSGAGIAPTWGRARTTEVDTDAEDHAEDLLARARAGDREAFREIYDRGESQIRGYLLARVGDPTTVDDLVQQTFLAAWLALPRYESRGVPIEAWLKRIAHNKAADYYRRRRPAVPLDMVDLSGMTEPRGVEEHALRRERADVLRRALRRLPETQRRVVELRFLGERSSIEVGEIMRCNPVTVRGIQFRALRSLRRSLEEGADI